MNFDSVDIQGRPSISIGDLKSKIIRMKNLDTCQNFDLVFSDARTGQGIHNFFATTGCVGLDSSGRVRGFNTSFCS